MQRTALAALDGRKGTVGVYNYKTGEILCAVSSPTYDPDDVPDVEGNPETYEGVYVNRFLHATYTPGSVFKLVTAAAALDEIPDIGSRTFTCEGSAVIGGETIQCNGVHGTLNFEEALAHSCNVVFGEICSGARPKDADALCRAGRRHAPAIALTARRRPPEALMSPMRRNPSWHGRHRPVYGPDQPLSVYDLYGRDQANGRLRRRAIPRKGGHLRRLRQVQGLHKLHRRLLDSATARAALRT